ncbi:MAG: hypothetical protein EA401_14335 [Planctomycetota bacterium]|nr:MAG: hypothetical protein EA401_14335 [Planctomycetota bacterium]
MRLTKLVPAMGLLAAAAAPSMGVELANGTISINGEVSVVAAYTDIEGAGLTIGHLADPEAGDTDAFGIMAEFELGLTYRVGEDVDATILIYGDDEGDVNLDEAYIVWQAHEQFALTAGYYGNWLGYGPAEDLTVTDSLVNNVLAGDNVVGFSGSSTVMDDGEQSFDVAAHIFKGSPHLGTLEGTDIGFALSAGYSNSAFGSVGGSLTWQPDDDDDVIVFNVFAEITMIDDLIIAGDLYYVDLMDNDVIGLSVLANYTLPTEFPSSITGGISLLLDENGALTGAPDDETVIEIQLAYLMNPTGNENFGINFEFKYTMYDEIDDDDMGLFAQFIATIP